jgi:photosystem II stability/assembly factor-like uncharacterized protein
MPIRSERQVAMGLKGGEGGQCLHGIERSRSDDKRIYLAVDVVGVWRSKDGGFSWEPCKNIGLHALGTSSIAVHPKDADRVLCYVQAAWEQPRQPEEGLYESKDGGETWNRVVQVKNGDTRRQYRHLIEYTADGGRVYFMSWKGGMYRSDNGGASFQGPLGLKDVGASEIRVDPKNKDVIYVAAEDGLYISRNAGSDFTKIESISGNIISLSIDPTRIWAVNHGQGLFRSEDGGKTFQHVSCGNAEIDSKAHKVFQSTIDPKRLILAADSKMSVTHTAGVQWKEPKLDFSKSFVQQGVWGLGNGMTWSHKNPNQIVGAISCGMYASSDGGATFTDSGTGYLGFHHGWSDGAVTFAADDPNRFAFFCYDYAFNITTDGGRSFRNGRLKEKVRDWWGMYVGDLHPQWGKNPVVIVAAGKYWRNQLVISEDAGKTFTAIPDTDGAYFFVRFHPKNPSIIYADDRRSDDGGKTFKKLSKPIYAFAPSNPDVVYAYGYNDPDKKNPDGKVWKSTDRGDNWSELPAPPRQARDWSARRDLEVDPKNPDKVWAMTPPHAAVFDGKNWKMIEAAKWVSPKGHAFVNRIAVDPDRPNRVVLGLDTHGTSFLFMSDDAGLSWKDITGNLPRLGSNQSLNIQPKTGRIFVGAGYGTWTAVIP